MPMLLFWVHCILQWVIIYKAQNEKPVYSHKWRWFNWRLLQVNAVAVSAKLLQTNLQYDGMAAYLPLSWGIGTVALMLMVVFAMYIPTRGLMFGRGKKTFSFLTVSARFLRKYHAYFIAFALTNDFWYHPFESFPGHLLGVINDCLLLWQSTVIYTPTHRHKWWCLCLETMVLPHSAFVAIERGTGASGAFGFAYFFILIMTQMWGVEVHNGFRALLVVIFLTSVGIVYGLELQYNEVTGEAIGLANIGEIFRIPPMVLFMPFFWAFWYMVWNACLNRTAKPSNRTCLAAVAYAFTALISFAPFFGLFGLGVCLGPCPLPASEAISNITNVTNSTQ